MGEPEETLAPTTTPKLRKELLSVLEILKWEIPIPTEVKLRVAFMKDAFGCVDLKEKTNERYFLITICKGIDSVHAKDTLLHEYAHCISWETSEEDHGPEWGLAFAKCYTIISGD
jgi:hypothetical protein